MLAKPSTVIGKQPLRPTASPDVPSTIFSISLVRSRGIGGSHREAKGKTYPFSKDFTAVPIDFPEYSFFESALPVPKFGA